jgi:phage gp45-like
MVTPDQKVKQLLRWCEVNEDNNESRIANPPNIPEQEVQYSGKIGNSVAWFPYGFHANLPKDTRGVMLNLGSEPSNRVVLGGSPDQRILIETGEVVIYHPNSGSKIHFRANGDIDIATDTNINVSANDVTLEAAGNVEMGVGGNVEMSVDGDVSVDSEGTVTIDAATKVDILSSEVNIGTAGLEKLMNETAMATFNGHTHTIGDPPTQQMSVDTDTTTETKAG